MPTLKEQGWYGKQAHKQWRKLVLQRDNYLCQECKRQGKITPARIAHHIKTTEDRPDLALDIDNGESLCFKCHEAEHDRVKPKEKELPQGVRVIKA